MKKWHLELEGMPQFDKAMERVNAWYEGEIIDRAPVKFSLHNAEFNSIPEREKKWNNLRERWFDAEYQVESFLEWIKGKQFLAESFPVFYPNLGPNVYSAFFGGELTFGEVTSWADHFLKDLSEVDSLYFNKENVYYNKINEITKCALEACEGKFIVGYTDLHPSMDCVADWRGSQQLCYDLYDDIDGVKKAINKASEDFEHIYNEFDSVLKKNNQLSVSWMGIPSFGRMHIPSCDFSSMISNDAFRELILPTAVNEMKTIDHNIWHLDGPGCARHLDDLLEVKKINAIQWVQGAGSEPIMQWVDLIKKIQSSGKSVVVNLHNTELVSFMDAVNPKGIFICVDADSVEQQNDMLKAIEKWSAK